MQKCAFAASQERTIPVRRASAYSHPRNGSSAAGGRPARRKHVAQLVDEHGRMAHVSHHRGVEVDSSRSVVETHALRRGVQLMFARE